MNDLYVEKPKYKAVRAIQIGGENTITQADEAVRWLTKWDVEATALAADDLNPVRVVVYDATGEAIGAAEEGNFVVLRIERGGRRTVSVMSEADFYAGFQPDGSEV